MISIGLFAHNEESHIEATLTSLAQQTLWAKTEDVECLIIANGCTDATVAVADACCGRLDCGSRMRVIHEEKPGKSAAWNKYIHVHACAKASCFILMDADIDFVEQDVLEKLVKALDEHQDAVVSVDVPVKDVAFHAHKSVKDRLSVASASLAATGAPKLCGQLYCVRREAVCSLWLPDGLLVEDGFLRAMLLTDNFSQPENVRRIVRVSDVHHRFEAETGFWSLFRHERRIFNGTAVNVILFGALHAMAENQVEIGPWIKEQNEGHPDWLREMVADSLQRAGRHGGMAWEMVGLPWMQWRKMRGKQALRCLPGALIRTLFNLLVGVASAYDVRKGAMSW